MTGEEKFWFLSFSLFIIFAPLFIPTGAWILYLIFGKAFWGKASPLPERKKEETPSPPPPQKSRYAPGDFVLLNSGKRGRVKKSYNLWHDVMVDGSEEFVHESEISSLQYRGD
jgi:hypothetical protein